MEMISYAITCNDEIVELKRLYESLSKLKRPEDEIVIQQDSTNSVNGAVFDYCKSLGDFIRYYGYPLNNHFANFKNNLSKICKGNFIVQLDADEIPNEDLINNLPEILEGNPSVDAYFIPRINTVDGLTQEYINKWGWRVGSLDGMVEEKEMDTNSDEYKLLKQNGLIIEEKIKNSYMKKLVKFYTPLVNWPHDYQQRIYRNDGSVTWKNKVHEVLTGYENFAALPEEEEYCIYHPKTLTKQIKQNDYYETI